MTAGRSGAELARDLLAYILIGVGLIVAIVLLTRFTNVEAYPLAKWIGFALVSAIVCGQAIHENRRYWRNRGFWLLLAIFFMVQTGFAIPLLSAVTRVPALYWALFYMFDSAALDVYLTYFSDWRGPAVG